MFFYFLIIFFLFLNIYIFYSIFPPKYIKNIYLNFGLYIEKIESFQL